MEGGTLAQLPVGIRKYIFDLVTHNCEHKIPEQLGDVDTGRENNKKEFTKEEINCYPSNLPSFYYPSLLLINKQYHAEVKEVIGLSTKLTYKLDCLIDSRRIYPTWTSLPFLSPHVDVVHAHIRLAGPQELSKGWNHECRCCVGGPGKKLWSLAALLLRFITRGPHFVSSKKNPTTIGTLIVNVDKTEFPSLNPIPEKEETKEKTERRETPTKLVDTLKAEIGYLLKPEDKRAKEMFRVICGKVQNVKLIFADQLVAEWEVASSEV